MQLTTIWKIVGTITTNTCPEFDPKRFIFFPRKQAHYLHNQYKDNRSVLLNMLKKTIGSDYWAEKWYELLNKMFVLDPNKRLDAYQLLKDPLFEKVRNIEYESVNCDCLSNIILASKKPITTKSTKSTKSTATNIDLIIYFSLENRLKHSTIYKALQISDKTHENNTISAYSSIYLANNFRDQIYISSEDIEKYAKKHDNEYNTNVLMKSCERILRDIDFDLIFSNALDFISIIYNSQTIPYSLLLSISKNYFKYAREKS